VRSSSFKKLRCLSLVLRTVSQLTTIASKQTSSPFTDPEGEDSEPSKVFSAVRFGWNSVFSVSKNGNKTLSDADIERIIDRTRGGMTIGGVGSGDGGSGSGGSDGDKMGEGEKMDVQGQGKNVLCLLL